MSAAVALTATSLVIPFEGLVLKAHYDPFAKIYDYCYGETENVDMKRTYTPEYCLSLVMAKLPRYEKEIKACVPNYDKLPVQVQSPMVSIGYNIGTGAMCKSKLFDAVRAGDLDKACALFTNYDKAGRPLKPVKGLTRRRLAEQAQCYLGLKTWHAKGDKV